MMNKKWIRLFILVLILFGLCDSYLRNLDQFSKGDYTILGAMDAILGVPDYKGHKSEISKISEILNISEEEWHTPACEAIDKLDCSEAKAGERCKIIPHNGLSSLKECLDIGNARIIQPQYCNHWNHENCLALSIFDYVLQRPDVLNKIIEVLERPCHYFPTEEELIKAGKDSKSGRSIFYKAREKMYCDDKDKKPYKIILKILDKHRDSRLDIVINRKE